MYTAYVLTDQTIEVLRNKFEPKYEKNIGDHITVDINVDKNSNPPTEATIRVVGRKDSGDGLEVLVVSVNGSVIRPDGKIYHITWSLDSEKYTPKDANILLADLSTRYILCLPINITTTSEICG